MRLVFLLILLTAFAANAGDEDHWAWQPIVRHEVPRVESGSRSSHPIDAFVLARLEQENLDMSPEADAVTLLRRLHLDLTGLLPSPDEVLAFRKRWNADPAVAYSATVDELLASPHFGERWARPWLDLARYADSDGYLGDTLRTWAWIYRDWVIDSINRDQPFDQFSIEQLAGDLIPNATEAQKIATGFHRNNLKNTEAGADRELARTKQIVDRVATTATTWLGLTVACAECHDHKHDPISQREFYELYAFFNQSKDADITVSAPAPFVAKIQSQAKPGKDGKIPEMKPKAQSVMDLKGDERRRSFVHIRGDYAREGDEVSPRTPAILHAFNGGDSPDRLSLAKWLFSPENPLTPRVAVNQIWQELFGLGLVSTPDDFGTYGERPSHPELLDWLATEFRDTHRWSRKKMIRSIVMSKTYRQSSVNRFPERSNEFLWRQNRFRLPADSVRDVHLVASGLFTPTIGGPGIRPPLPEFVTAVGRSVKWPTEEGPDRYRRGLYIFLKRTVMYPMLTTFDAPDTSTACSRREKTNSPMQALTLLNDPVFFECAEALGKSAGESSGGSESPAELIGEIFLRCLNREPDAQELATLESAYRDFLTESKNDRELAAVALARVVMNLDEFISRD